MSIFSKTLVLGSFLFFTSLVLKAQINQTAVESFINGFSSHPDLSPEEVRGILEKAEYQESIVEKMSNPAESRMTWYRYRNIFMKDERILAGVGFWNEHSAALENVSNESGVPVEVILGILGVETYFGERKGTYKVLDALYTLAFGYPKRARFFTSELKHFLELARDEKLDVHTLLGSYAGAMGYSQFMPSSYKAYAKSYDVGGTKDLVNSPEDAIASVANYLAVHRWKKGQMVVAPAVKSSEAQTLKKQSLKPKYSISHYSKLGYRPVGNISPSSISTLIALEQEDDMEYWFGFNNFYVITRYNHSEMYAMAVYQLAEAIKERKEAVDKLR
ncbi:MAG: lytic murein transglycosylase B [Cyclobacteriaceae bacterium]